MEQQSTLNDKLLSKVKRIFAKKFPVEDLSVEDHVLKDELNRSFLHGMLNVFNWNYPIPIPIFSQQPGKRKNVNRVSREKLV